MKSVRNMLNVLMDGIKDAEMWIGYAEEADSEGRSEWADWFRTHAKKRIDALDSIRDYVYKAANVPEKIASGDDLACALKDHVDEQVAHLKEMV